MMGNFFAWRDSDEWKGKSNQNPKASLHPNTYASSPILNFRQPMSAAVDLRIFDDLLVHCVSFAISSVDDYRNVCFVSHRFRRLAANIRALGHIRVRSSRFTDAHCATFSQSSQAWTYLVAILTIAILSSPLSSVLISITCISISMIIIAMIIIAIIIIAIRT